MCSVLFYNVHSNNCTSSVYISVQSYSKSPKCFGLPGVPSSRSPVSNPQNVPLYGKRVGTVTHLHTELKFKLKQKRKHSGNVKMFIVQYPLWWYYSKSKKWFVLQYFSMAAVRWKLLVLGPQYSQGISQPDKIHYTGTAKFRRQDKLQLYVGNMHLNGTNYPSIFCLY